MIKTCRFILADGREVCGKVNIKSEIGHEWIVLHQDGQEPSHINMQHVMMITPVPFRSARLAPVKAPADQSTKEKLERELELADVELFNLAPRPCQCCPADIDSESPDPQ